jgi:hypothetical protein
MANDWTVEDDRQEDTRTAEDIDRRDARECAMADDEYTRRREEQ